MEQYDVFICHASEDKESLVRPLARALEGEHVAVWFDEFTLRPGDSLRRSIDIGLTRSRFGVVVLSRSFFAKGWPQRELDGLVAREMVEDRRLVVPIWHGVTTDDVCAFSPPLADVLAVRSDSGLDHVVSELMRVVRPKASPLIVARDILFDYGLEPPVVTDEWWLDMVAVSNWLSPWGFVPDCGEWGPWSFPLPDDSTAQGKGERIAWAALQMAWCDAAKEARLSQLTPPDQVLTFIESHPGLTETCHAYPHFLAAYMPQLTIPGLGGPFEEDFDTYLERDRSMHDGLSGARSGTALTTTGDTPGCSESIALHDPEFGNLKASHVACTFVQGELNGPPCRIYEYMDYAVWLLSAQGDSWLPQRVRAYLLEGMKQWPVWPWYDRFREDKEFGVSEYPGMGALCRALMEGTIVSGRELAEPEHADLLQRIMASCALLDLPESAEVLTERFVREGFIDAYMRDRKNTSS